MSKVISINLLKSELDRSLVDRHVDKQKLHDVLVVANRYHDGQFREHKDGADYRVPYITHPVGVAKFCAELWPFVDLDDSLEDVLAAALTHDLLEDTSIEISELETTTSSRAADLVQALTKPSASSFSDRSERNRIFLRTISSHSSSAKYIKLCDALHNLSRPNSMPVSLLEKTIRKAKRDYLPLTLDDRFSKELRQRVEAAIKNAEAVLADSKDNKFHHSTFEGFLAYCIDRVKGKVLETHDILDILLELPGLSKISEGTVDVFQNNFLVDYLESADKNRIIALEAKLLDEGTITITGKIFNREKTKLLPFQQIFALPHEGPIKDLTHRDYFFLGHDRSKSFDWISLPSLRAIVSVLSERKRELESRQLLDYANWVTSKNLSIDPRLAAKLRMERSQLCKLALLNDAAEIEIGAIIAAVKLIGRTDGDDLKNEMLIVEHRIKSATSSAIKLIQQAKGDWKQVGDIIGIRVVLLNEKAVTRFIGVLKKQLEDPESIWNYDIGVYTESITIHYVKPSSGYQAMHVNFLVKTALEDLKSVPCEIQVRTVFEDAWARIAHTIQYKSEKNISRAQARNLKKLSKLRDDADTLANSLTTRAQQKS